MKPGYKSTELYLVICVVAPWVLSRTGIDISSLLGRPEDIAQIISDAHAQSGDAPVWVVLAYVAARFFLKWREAK